MTSKPKVYIIILNWNGWKDTIECLKSIRDLRSKIYDLRVVVVDNSSTDGSLLHIKNFVNRESYVVILENEKNLGYAGGNNIGIKYALKNSADFICILNNDTIVDRNLINEFLKAAKKYLDASIFTPKIYFAKGFEFHKKRYKNSELGKVIWSAGGKIDWNNVYGNNVGVDQVDKGQFDKEVETDFATGACLFIRSNCFNRVGLLDERYFLYLEDLEFSVRAKNKGQKIIYVPGAVVSHKISQSSGVGSELNDYYISRNRMLFGTNYAPFRSRLALIRESFWLAQNGRKWQTQGIKDFYLRKFGKGSWK